MKRILQATYRSVLQLADRAGLSKELDCQFQLHAVHCKGQGAVATLSLSDLGVSACTAYVQLALRKNV